MTTVGLAAAGSPGCASSRRIAAASVFASPTLPGRTSLRRGKPFASRESARVTSGQSSRRCFERPWRASGDEGRPQKWLLVRSKKTIDSVGGNSGALADEQGVLDLRALAPQQIPDPMQLVQPNRRAAVQSQQFERPRFARTASEAPPVRLDGCSIRATTRAVANRASRSDAPTARSVRGNRRCSCAASAMRSPPTERTSSCRKPSRCTDAGRAILRPGVPKAQPTRDLLRRRAQRRPKGEQRLRAVQRRLDQADQQPPLRARTATSEPG